MEFPEVDPDSLSPTLPPSPLPCWATQALCDLARAETELRRLRERQAFEAEVVKRGVERAVLGARREECRLLERVEQDHRDAQLGLEQLLRENAAAARVSQSLLSQRLGKLAHLREQIQRSGGGGQQQDSARPEQDLLVKGVADLLQPWEISLSLKKVSFKPSSQPNAVSFGDIRVQEHNLSLPGGGCGLTQGQLCPLHAGEMQCGGGGGGGGHHHGGGGGSGGDGGRSTPDGAHGGPTTLTSPTGRSVRKIRLSVGRSDEEEEPRMPSVVPKRTRQWPPPRKEEEEQSDRESSQEDEETESPTSEPPPGEDGFLSVPAAATLDHADSEGEERSYRTNNSGGRHYSPRSPRKPRAVAPIVSDGERSPSPERGRQERPRVSQRWSTTTADSRDGERARARQDSNRGVVSRHGGYASSVTSPKMAAVAARNNREPLASQSCVDLTSSRGGMTTRPHSRLSQSSDDYTHGTSGDSGRAPSPTDSLDSCYTFIVSSPRDVGVGGSSRGGPLNHNPRLSKSTADLTHKTRPLVSGSSDCVGVWRVNRSNHKSNSARSSPTPLGNKKASSPCPGYRGVSGIQQQHHLQKGGLAVPVVRSLSMSRIDGSTSYSPDRNNVRGRRDRGEPALVEMEEEGGGDLQAFPQQLHTGGSHLVRQFGKQGSGRAELTLPSGVHVTAQGQLFIVDCGNARVQVTDPQGNIMQQVTSPTSDSSRRCRNYFDIAVNAKGLIALSCAAERALLVFNRHGRLLQTFGGSGTATGSQRDDLEAPRGVTVTRLDEFLVADIRKGTLVALKLDTKTGSRLERTVVTGFHRPYLVAACLTSGMVAVSERGSETGREPCVKVLEPGWNTVRVLGVCSGMGPVLVSPWGICIDGDGNVLVADWGDNRGHRIVLYPAQGVGWPVVTQGLSSPRGLALLPDGHLVVSDSMHHCIKMYQYK